MSARWKIDLVKSRNRELVLLAMAVGADDVLGIPDCIAYLAREAERDVAKRHRLRFNFSLEQMTAREQRYYGFR